MLLVLWLFLLLSPVFTVVLSDSGPFFNSGGGLGQVELANKATFRAGTILAIKSERSVVILSLSNQNALPIVASPSKIRKLGDFSGVGTAGIISDSNHLTNIAFDESLSHRTKFNCDPPLSKLSSHVAGYMHTHTLSAYRRPFGASLCLFGCDDDGKAKIYEVDSLGTRRDCKVSGIGRFGRSLTTKWPAELDTSHLSVSTMIRQGIALLRNCTGERDSTAGDEQQVAAAVDSSTLDIHVVSSDLPLRSLGRDCVHHILAACSDAKYVSSEGSCGEVDRTVERLLEEHLARTAHSAASRRDTPFSIPV